MNYVQYLNLFEEIINSKNPEPPYSDPKYLTYAKLNFARMKRWQKTLQLNDQLVHELKAFNRCQQWIIVVEPWCADAAPTLPFLVKLAEQNPLIQFGLQWRDREPFLINSYLTNGTKSIPKLIVRDEAGDDLFVWGPRPKAAQELVNELKAGNSDHDLLTAEVQSWYNNDKGIALQQELLQLFKTLQLQQKGEYEINW